MNLTQRSVVQNDYDFDAFESFLIVESNCVHVFGCDSVTVYQNLKFLLNEKVTQL